MFFSLLFCSAVSEQRVLSAYYDSQTKTFSFKDEYDETAASRGVFSNDVEKTGWYNLQIEGDRITDNIIESRAAGMIEGQLTAHLLKDHKSNVYNHICDKYVVCENGKIPAKISEFFEDNYEWVKNMIESSHEEDPFFFSGKMLFEQIEGLVDGYNIVYPDEKITYQELWQYMSHAMIVDLARSYTMNLSKADAPLMPRRGTGIVGQSAAQDNIFIGQAAWRSYGEAIRIAKRYRLRYNSSWSIVDRRSLSSYPFLLHSDDEFTICDMGLAIISSSIATTLDIAQGTVFSSQGFPYWFRSVVSTQSSHSSGEWYSNYKYLSSTGTGIEYLIIDIKKFKYKEGYQPEFIFLIDEIPGKILGTDVTETFKARRFMATYDIPYIREIFESAGYGNLSTQDVNWYSYNESARAKIFQIRAQTIYNDVAMKKLIRLNDPVNVAQQGGNATNAIAGRFELAKDDSARCFGAFDAKFTTIPRMLHSQWSGQVGASRDNTPPLNLDNSAICQSESRTGVDPLMYNSWADQYFDIEIE